jgi:sporulation protein YlmC with PRC-barrel domain
MTLIGEVFVADVLGKAVLDPVGEEIGTLRDIAVEGGAPFPRAAGLVLEKKKKTWFLPWSDLNIFNRRIISSRKRESELSEYHPSQEQLLIGRDILDKQIVDINGAKVVRVNDVKLTDEGGAACVTDVDVGVRGILRRLGVERRGDAFFQAIRHPLRHQLISWEFIQPLESKLDRLTLALSREALSKIHPSDIAQIISGMSPDERKGFFERLDLETARGAHELEPEYRPISRTWTRSRRPTPSADAARRGGRGHDLREKARNPGPHGEGRRGRPELPTEDTAGALRSTSTWPIPGITIGEAMARFRKDAEEIGRTLHLCRRRGEAPGGPGPARPHLRGPGEAHQ